MVFAIQPAELAQKVHLLFSEQFPELAFVEHLDLLNAN